MIHDARIGGKNEGKFTSGRATFYGPSCKAHGLDAGMGQVCALLATACLMVMDIWPCALALTGSANHEFVGEVCPHLKLGSEGPFHRSGRPEFRWSIDRQGRDPAGSRIPPVGRTIGGAEWSSLSCHYIGESLNGKGDRSMPAVSNRRHGLWRAADVTSARRTAKTAASACSGMMTGSA